jgi:hypothetical protein
VTNGFVALKLCTSAMPVVCQVQGLGRMELKVNDWVETESGELGKVIHISRLTVFVAFPIPGKEDLVQGYLESQLTKVE